MEPHLPVIIERCVNGTATAMVLVFGRNRHELLVWVFLLWRIIRLALLEVRGKSYSMVSNVESSFDK